MADNTNYNTDSTTTIAAIATKEVTFSGDTTSVQLMELVAVGGTEGSRTITEISDETNGVLVDLGSNNDVTVASGTVTTVSTVTNVSQFGGVAISLNTGVRDTGTLRVTIATDDVVPVTGTFFQATQPVSGTVTANPASGTIDTVTTVSTVTAVTSLTQMNGAAIAMNTGVRAAGVQRVTIATDDVVPVTGTFWQATQPVSGTVTANPASGTIDTVTNVSQFGGVAISLNTGVRDTGTQRVTIATNDLVPISAASLPLPSGAATSAAQLADGHNVTVDNADGDAAVASQGQVAHDAVNAGNPVVTGHQAIAHGTNPTAVAAADATKSYANRAGIPFQIGGHPNVITLSSRVEDADGALTDLALVTVGAGAKVVVTRISYTADATNTNPTNVSLGFGATTIPAHAHTGVTGILQDFMGIPAGGGITVGNGGGILGVGADGEDLRMTCEDPVGGAVTITISYYTIES